MRWLKSIPSRADRAIVVLVLATGLLLPWIVAAGVKIYLDAHGRPTWPWEAFVLYAPLGLPASAIAALPLALLAKLYRAWAIGELGRFSRATPLQRRLVVLSGLAGGAAGMVRVCIWLFWEFDPMVLWFPFEIAALCVPSVAGGLVVGALLALGAGLVVRPGPGARPPPAS